VLEWSEEQETFPSSEGSGLPTSEDDAIDRLEELIAAGVRADFRPELVVGYGTAGDELLRLSLERGADLIVLGAQRRSPVERAIFGSTARRLVRSAPCPVLQVR
jgi:nucleotide-binding universal stress UspA family protein